MTAGAERFQTFNSPEPEPTKTLSSALQEYPIWTVLFLYRAKKGLAEKQTRLCFSRCTKIVLYDKQGIRDNVLLFPCKRTRAPDILLQSFVIVQC